MHLTIDCSLPRSVRNLGIKFSSQGFKREFETRSMIHMDYSCLEIFLKCGPFSFVM